MSSAVEKKRLRDLLSFVVDNRGRTCPTADHGRPLIATNCVKNSTLYPVFEKVRYVDHLTYENWFRAHPKPRDLIFVLKGSPGQVCLAPDPVNFCIAQDMVALRADPSQIDDFYLFAALRSPQIQEEIGKLHVGSLIAHFKKGDFDRLEIPVPDRATQEAIGRIYLVLSQKIELNREMAATLEAMARTLYQSWFVDFDPVWAEAVSKPCTVLRFRESGRTGMAGFIEGVQRGQTVLFPDRLEDWIGEEDLVRVVDLFVEELDLSSLGFVRASSARTGRPGYHPGVLLKLFIYGYLNRIPSSRRLEREAARNVEVMWLTGRLVPDHKTIAEFRRQNGAAIRKACARFVELCRRIGVLKGDAVAIDGSKFKAVNNRDKNFTKNKIASRLAHLEADVARYIDVMVRIDRQEEGEARTEKVAHLARRYGRIRQEIARLQAMEKALAEAPDGQISLTDPDARAMATSARHSGMVGYNVQSAVDIETHLIVAHEVTNQGFDRDQLSPMAIAAKTALGREDLNVLADKGYFSGAEILSCHAAGITTTVPRPATSGNAAKGWFVKADFLYDPARDVYTCPAGNELIYRYTREEGGLQVRRYWINGCQTCPVKGRCTTGTERRITRWEHEPLIDAMRERLSRDPDPMTLRRCTVEHPFGTIKGWMGYTHFLTRRLKNVRTEMALNVLAYNIKRMIALVGIRGLMEAIPG